MQTYYSSWYFLFLFYFVRLASPSAKDLTSKKTEFKNQSSNIKVLGKLCYVCFDNNAFSEIQKLQE